MFPNPQDALPLPPRPSVEQYRKLAKDLVKACRSDDPDAIGAWTDRWLASLSKATAGPGRPRGVREIDRAAAQLEDFATRRLKAGGADGCWLSEAQFVVARSHGFDSWPKLVAHLDRLAHAGSDVAGFEAAADAIVSGDEPALRRLLAADPSLARAVSTREHGATLLHYVSANGVENYRQRTPPNIVAIARILLDAGAEVDAEADVYGGGSTPLGLVATSAHPRAAGVQIPLLQLLIERGARIEPRGIAGHSHGVVMACLANGCPEAAAFLAERVSHLDLVEAAGVGRLDLVTAFLDAGGERAPAPGPDEVHSAFRHACFCGRTDVVEYLVARRVDLAGHDGDGQTGLHYAAMGGQLETARLLLEHGAPLEARNQYGGTVLGQTLWSAAHGGDPRVFAPLVEALIEAGAKLYPEPPVNAEVDAVLIRHGCPPDPTLWWFGEKPREKKTTRSRPQRG
ncbi:MAG TPA: ankyrin repeat domain-containing protein [Gemmatimonadales bacterium]|nr:ankyrin repeat domain-containing protein [Gemmatimonadales bacterium]